MCSLHVLHVCVNENIFLKVITAIIQFIKTLILEYHILFDCFNLNREPLFICLPQMKEIVQIIQFNLYNLISF